MGRLFFLFHHNDADLLFWSGCIATGFFGGGLSFWSVNLELLLKGSVGPGVSWSATVSFCSCCLLFCAEGDDAGGPRRSHKKGGVFAADVQYTAVLSNRKAK